MTMSLTEDDLSTAQFARALAMSVRTVKFWCMRGWVRARQTPGGHYRIPRTEVERVKRGDPMPEMPDVAAAE